MAKTGDCYEIILKDSHIRWGEGPPRKTASRPQRKYEAYIPIPRIYAKSFCVYNSNYKRGLGYNLFQCTSSDGLLNGTLKSTGSSEAGDIYAKQFSGNGDLTLLGKWFNTIGVKIGDRIKVEWVTPTDIVLTHKP